MRKKKAEESAAQGVELPAKHGAAAEHDKGDREPAGVIDMDPTPAPTFSFNLSSMQSEAKAKPQTQYDVGVAELNADNPTTPKAKRKYTKRAKTTEASAVKPLADSNRIYEKAVEVFRMYFNGEIAVEPFLARINDLKTFQSLATKLNDNEYGK